MLIYFILFIYLFIFYIILYIEHLPVAFPLPFYVPPLSLDVMGKCLDVLVLNVTTPLYHKCDVSVVESTWMSE